MPLKRRLSQCACSGRILLLMHFDHSQEWLRLTGEYRKRSDEELALLYRDFNDLTDVAKQTLTAEMQSRGLDKKIAAEREAAAAKQSRVPGKSDRTLALDVPVKKLERNVFGHEAPQPVNDEPEEDESAAGDEVEYTWKTILCEGLEYDQSWQVREVLRRAGIKSWIERAGMTGGGDWAGDSFVGDIRVLVAADELDRARAIIANPIPQEIIDESHEPVLEYHAPRCPGCGADDPVLESAEPVNAWKCEMCGREWTDGAAPTQARELFT